MAIKWDFNFGTVISIGIPLIGGLLWVNTQITSLEARLNQSENFRSQRTSQTDRNFIDLTAAIRSLQEVSAKQNADLGNLLYRMGQNESSINGANQRMDRIADSVLNSVDSIKKDVGVLGTKVEVMNQKIDSLDVPRTRGKVGGDT